jgi:hypothetical protein
MHGEMICQRFDQLASQRSTLDTTLQSIEELVVPYRGEFFKPMSSEHEVEWRRRGIFDSTAPIAADLLASSIHSNLTSPMIQWFKLQFRDAALNKNTTAVAWLEAVEAEIWQALQASDFNMEVAEIYLDLVSFGTAIMFQEEISDKDWEGMTFTAMPIMDSYFEDGADDRVLRVYRRLRYTKLQLEDKFPDYEFDQSMTDDPDTKHEVIFCVYKRDEVTKVTERMAPKARPWGYKYVLKETGEVLDEGGYYTNPAMVPRWKKVSGSRWGHSPAMICLSDIRQLNTLVEMTTEARAKEIDPPMKSTERGVLGDLDLTAGGLTIVTEMDQLDRLLKPNVTLFQADIEREHRQISIRSTFYVDKLELKESPVMTATEVLARLEKNQRQFAPTLGRMVADLLDPLINNTYEILGRNGQLPEVPEGLEEVDMDIEYIGPIPRAMKSEEAQGTALWLGEMANYAQVIPDLLDVIDTDALARGLGLARGVPASYMRSAEEVEEIRNQRQQQQAAMQQLEAAESASKTIGNVEKLRAAQ